MEIKLKGNYVITSDSNQFILSKISISNGEKNKGQEVKTPIAYHTTLESTLNSYVNKVLLSSGANTLKELLNELKALKTYIKEITQ